MPQEMFKYMYTCFPRLDKQYETVSDLYVRPWLRITPYLVGMATSYLLTKWNYKLHLSKVINPLYLCVCVFLNNTIKFLFQKSIIVGWTLAILCNCSILFGVANKNMPLSLSITYSTLSRTGWSIGIAWLVIACCTNHGGKLFTICFELFIIIK